MTEQQAPPPPAEAAPPPVPQPVEADGQVLASPYIQIVEVNATPLDAAEALERSDAYGRVPLVVRVQRQPPIRVELILIAIVRDLVRYAYGRLSDPPMPAGVVPGARGAAVVAARATPTPSVYRGIAARPARSAGGSAPATLPTLSASTVVRRSARASSVTDSSWRTAQ